jgi:hypothetical protein
LSRTFKLWSCPSCLKPTRRPTTTTQSSTSSHAFMTIQTRCRKQRTSYTLSSRAPTLFMHIWLSSNVFSTKLVVRIGQTLTKSLCFAIASTLRYRIDLLSSLISLASTLILYELSNS